MNIAILSKSDRLGGGGGRCAEDLVNLLKKNNVNVDHFARSSKYTEIIPLYTSKEKWIYHRLRSVGFQELYPFEKKVIKKYDIKKDYDIFHFHDISSAISPLTLKWLSDKNKKIIWTLHDCTAITGGCVNPLDCTKYKSICYNCPQLGQFPLGQNIDLSFLFHSIKKHVLKNSNIQFVTPSKWLADLVYSTGYTKSYPIVISNGVDTNLFKAYEKDIIRKELGLPQDKFIILLSSSSFDNPYKGIIYSIETIKLLKKINPLILMIGKIDEEVSKKLEEFHKIQIGYIEDKKTLNKYYSSADIFLNTTIADNFPISVLESMASGTPNIGFATGGIPEIIEQGIDGYLVKNRDIEELKNKIMEFYSDYDVLVKMQRKAREKVLKNFTLEKFFENYFNLYVN
ncbi:glycosyltransferase [Arcobacter sp.]|uniref:glycosyltransferase n=1 Tax=Arcobacter sp. TaxID=1872629 RepID=UPI003D0DB35F